ncbi:MAG: hypothetical protein ABSE89_11965 [Sedimentisphaerales bacterium]
MAVARQEQSGTMLYTVITFVALFIVSAVLAVVFYLKSEDWRDQYTKVQQDAADIASQSEVRNIGTLVGQKERNHSRLGQVLGYIDQLYVMLVGIAPQETSAEVKVTEIQADYNDILAKLPKEIVLSEDPNGTGIFKLIENYNRKLQQKQEFAEQLASQIEHMNKENELAKKGASQREEDLRNQIRTEQQKADDVQQSYNQLRDLMDKKATEREQTLTKERDDAIDEKNKAKQELQVTLSKLSVTQNRLEEALSKLDILKPRPKEDIAAYKPDGHIITVDNSSNVVFIDIGSEAKVYPGLTFAVYDKSGSIPTDGSSKAEIEVFNVDKNTSIARINKSSKKNPIIEGDIIVNLVWDSEAVNKFVVAGDFDLNGDGTIDVDGAAKIKQLIENWGGKVEDVVTIDTDFVVLGVPPQVRKKPTLDEIEADPMANEKYEASVKASEQYQEVKNQAKDLYIPVFSLKRFLNFIGYESLASGVKKK